MTPEELASTFEGHAASCDRQAGYQRNRERAVMVQDRAQHHDLAIINETKAATLREVAARIREEFTAVTELLAQNRHVLVISENTWVIEHSIDCRLSSRMADCEFTVWARENLTGSRRYPLGRFLMAVDDPMYMALMPV